MNETATAYVALGQTEQYTDWLLIITSNPYFVPVLGAGLVCLLFYRWAYGRGMKEKIVMTYGGPNKDRKMQVKFELEKLLIKFFDKQVALKRKKPFQGLDPAERDEWERDLAKTLGMPMLNRRVMDRKKARLKQQAAHDAANTKPSEVEPEVKPTEPAKGEKKLAKLKATHRKRGEAVVM